jgi:hypothetical protein
MKKPEDLNQDVTLEDVQDEFCSGENFDVLSRAIGIIEDTQNGVKRGSMVMDVCWNLEIVRCILRSIVKNRSQKKCEVVNG